ncbi:MAG: carbohydrate kinase family protein, partial [Candidatus Paceibacterota bacterium]
EKKGKTQRFSIEGDKVELEKMRVFSGGGGTNTAVGFARLGFKVGLISETGKDNFASVILAELHREEVDTSLIIQEKQEQTGGTVLLVAKDGERTALINRGASSMLDPFDISPFWISQTRWVHLTNIAGQEETLRKIFKLIKKNEQTTLSWNPGKQELQLIADGKLPVAEIVCKVLILNEAEWELIGEQQAELIKEIPTIVVTQGKKGGFVYEDGQKTLRFLASGDKAVESTGAGDAFSTGFVAGQLLNKPTKTCVEWGVRNAGSVISHFGAKLGLLDRQRIQTA